VPLCTNTSTSQHLNTGVQPQDSGAKRLVMIPFRLVRALYKEAVVTLSGGSVFLDSPLNEDGVAQVARMHTHTHTHTHTHKHTHTHIHTYVSYIHAYV